MSSKSQVSEKFYYWKQITVDFSSFWYRIRYENCKSYEADMIKRIPNGQHYLLIEIYEEPIQALIQTEPGTAIEIDYYYA